MGPLIRRICVELKRPFFEVEKWPISEISKWAAHFELEHEEFERAMQERKTGVKTVSLSKETDTDEFKNNCVMAVF